MRCPSISELPPPPAGSSGWPWDYPETMLTSLMPDGSPWPLISIVTPSFNQGEFIEETIRSILLQGYPNLEYIIIDGGSTDNSVETIRKYEKHLSYWVSEPDRGQSHAINKGFERATGEIFGWLNSDDCYAPAALQAVLEAFKDNPSAGAVVGAGDLVDIAHNVLRHVEPFDVSVETLYHWIDRFFMQPSCFFTKKAWKVCGPLDEDIHFAMDLDLWLRIAKKLSCARTDTLLSTSLVHKDAKTTLNDELARVDAALVIVCHGGFKKVRMQLVDRTKQKILDFFRQPERWFRMLWQFMIRFCHRTPNIG